MCTSARPAPTGCPAGCGGYSSTRCPPCSACTCPSRVSHRSPVSSIDICRLPGSIQREKVEILVTGVECTSTAKAMRSVHPANTAATDTAKCRSSANTGSSATPSFMALSGEHFGRNLVSPFQGRTKSGKIRETVVRSSRKWWSVDGKRRTR